MVINYEKVKVEQLEFFRYLGSHEISLDTYHNLYNVFLKEFKKNGKNILLKAFNKARESILGGFRHCLLELRCLNPLGLN